MQGAAGRNTARIPVAVVGREVTLAIAGFDMFAFRAGESLRAQIARVGPPFGPQAMRHLILAVEGEADPERAALLFTTRAIDDTPAFLAGQPMQTPAFCHTKAGLLRGSADLAITLGDSRGGAVRPGPEAETYSRYDGVQKLPLGEFDYNVESADGYSLKWIEPPLVTAESSKHEIEVLALLTPSEGSGRLAPSEGITIVGIARGSRRNWWAQPYWETYDNREPGAQRE